MIKSEKNPIFYYITIFVVCLFSFFINNQAIPPDYMESRNLATAQEMVKFGNYLTPTMNGEPRLEKPPLPTWVAAVVTHINPDDNISAQRSMTGIMGTLMIFFLFYLVSYLTKNKNIGLFAALICATTYNVIMWSRNATWDMYCHSFMLGAIYFMVKAFDNKGKQWLNFILAGVLMGLSFLSKGPVSFHALLLPFLIAYIIVYKPVWKGKTLPLLTMIFICIILSVWWYGYNYLFQQDILLQITEKETTSWINRNVKPFYYYWQFPVEAGIWTVFWVTSLIYYFVKSKGKEYRELYTFSVIWTFASLILLSLVPEKKTRYLLPMLIPGSISIALYLYYSVKYAMSKWDRIVFRMNTGLIILILFALPIGLYIFFVHENVLSLPVYLIIALLFTGIGVFMLVSISGKETKLAVNRVFYGVILTMIVIGSFCLPVIEHIFINDERYSIRALRTEPRIDGYDFYYDENVGIRMELVYEMNQIVRPLDLENPDAVYEKLPFVLVSVESPESLLQGKQVTIEYINRFDNNWRKPTHKRYNDHLVSYVAIIKPSSENKE